MKGRKVFDLVRQNVNDRGYMKTLKSTLLQNNNVKLIGLISIFDILYMTYVTLDRKKKKKLLSRLIHHLKA